MIAIAVSPAVAIAATTTVAIIIWLSFELFRVRRRAAAAERRFDLLHALAPALTTASTESTSKACARILDRFASLVGARTMLCFFARDERLVLGAKSGEGYIGFLREGDEFGGGAIVEWVRDGARPAIVGPAPAALGPESGYADLTRDARAFEVGPVAGSRDRVWAIGLPLARSRGYGLRPEVLGVIYAERVKDEPFRAEELATALTIARLSSDALARALYADSVRRESERDQLTGLLTPSKFRKRLSDELEARRYADGRASRDIGLLFIDTDNFKPWNDAFGHAAGDRLLRALAQEFEDTAKRAGGFAGRNGGDEFCLALLDRTKDATISLAEELRTRIDRWENGMAGDDGRAAAKITVSVGVAHFPVDVLPNEQRPSDKLLELADAKMYDAKRRGRNRVEWKRGASAARREPIPGEGPIPRR